LRRKSERFRVKKIEKIFFFCFNAEKLLNDYRNLIVLEEARNTRIGKKLRNENLAEIKIKIKMKGQENKQHEKSQHTYNIAPKLEGETKDIVDIQFINI